MGKVVPKLSVQLTITAAALSLVYFPFDEADTLDAMVLCLSIFIAGVIFLFVYVLLWYRWKLQSDFLDFLKFEESSEGIIEIKDDSSFNEIVEIARKHIGVRSIEIHENHLEITTNVTMVSFGEVIRVQRLGDEVVIVSSRKKRLFPIFDACKNMYNRFVIHRGLSQIK